MHAGIFFHVEFNKKKFEIIPKTKKLTCKCIIKKSEKNLFLAPLWPLILTLFKSQPQKSIRLVIWHLLIQFQKDSSTNTSYYLDFRNREVSDSLLVPDFRKVYLKNQSKDDHCSIHCRILRIWYKETNALSYNLNKNSKYLQRSPEDL